jgi:hypothetical protein
MFTQKARICIEDTLLWFCFLHLCVCVCVCVCVVVIGGRYKPSRVRLPLRSLGFPIDLNLAAALWAVELTELLTEISTRKVPGCKGQPHRHIFTCFYCVSFFWKRSTYLTQLIATLFYFWNPLVQSNVGLKWTRIYTYCRYVSEHVRAPCGTCHLFLSVGEDLSSGI